VDRGVGARIGRRATRGRSRSALASAVLAGPSRSPGGGMRLGRAVHPARRRGDPPINARPGPRRGDRSPFGASCVLQPSPVPRGGRDRHRPCPRMPVQLTRSVPDAQTVRSPKPGPTGDAERLLPVARRVNRPVADVKDDPARKASRQDASHAGRADPRRRDVRDAGRDHVGDRPARARDVGRGVHLPDDDRHRRFGRVRRVGRRGRATGAAPASTATTSVSQAMRAREYVNGISNMRCTSGSRRRTGWAAPRSPNHCPARLPWHATTHTARASLPDPAPGASADEQPATRSRPITRERVGAEQPTEGRARSRAQRPGRTQTRRR